jgi:putative Holliday junction resolvase
MRILGLDYGEKRIGVAVSDELGLTAQGVTVIERRNRRADLDALHRLIEEYAVEKVVVGYPCGWTARRGSSVKRSTGSPGSWKRRLDARSSPG